MIEIYSKDQCIFCHMAKEYFESANKEYTEYKIGVDVIREEVLEKFPSMKTVPVIVIDGELIGGYTEMMNYFKKRMKG